MRVHGINQYEEEYHHPKGVEKLPCDQCSSVFNHRGDLNSHIRTKHKEVGQKFTCEQCPSTYVHKKSLQVHIKLKHGAEKEEFCCPVCQKKFELKKRLTRHLLIHDRILSVMISPNLCNIEYRIYLFKISFCFLVASLLHINGFEHFCFYCKSNLNKYVSTIHLYRTIRIG